MTQNRFWLNPLFHYYLIFNFLIKHKKVFDKVLDYGSGNGEFIASLRPFARELYGYDVDNQKVKLAQKKIKYVKFSYGKVGEKTLFTSNTFEVIFLLHVLEHVNSESETINEIFRLLKKDGLLFLASPYKGLFAWADIANLRYKIPLVHKIIGYIYYGKDNYQNLFIKNKNEKLFGDSSLTRQSHKHYQEEEVRELLNDKFEIIEFRKFSLFQPFLLLLYNFYFFVFKKESIFIKWLIWFDNHLNVKDYSYSFFLIAVKKT